MKNKKTHNKLKVKEFLSKALKWLQKAFKVLGLPLLLLLIILPKNCSKEAKALQVQGTSSYYYSFSPIVVNTAIGSSNYNVSIAGLGFYADDGTIVLTAPYSNGAIFEYYPTTIEDSFIFKYKLNYLMYYYISGGNAIYRNSFLTVTDNLNVTITLVKDPYIVNNSLDSWFEDTLIYDGIDITYADNTMSIDVLDGADGIILTISIDELPFNSVSSSRIELNSYKTLAYSIGYSAGLNDGYLEGYDDGISSTTPFTPILSGVTTFLNTPFFGSFCLMDVLKIVGVGFLFVLFIKFFVGG